MVRTPIIALLLSLLLWADPVPVQPKAAAEPAINVTVSRRRLILDDPERNWLYCWTVDPIGVNPN